jgi:hypothetical protein
LQISKVANGGGDSEPAPAVVHRDLWLRNNNARQSPFAGRHDRLTLPVN